MNALNAPLFEIGQWVKVLRIIENPAERRSDPALLNKVGPVVNSYPAQGVRFLYKVRIGEEIHGFDERELVAIDPPNVTLDVVKRGIKWIRIEASHPLVELGAAEYLLEQAMIDQGLMDGERRTAGRTLARRLISETWRAGDSPDQTFMAQVGAALVQSLSDEVREAKGR